jgi:hypothetical protein
MSTRQTRIFIFMSIFLLTVTFLFTEDVRKVISVEEAMEIFCNTWVNSKNNGIGRWHPHIYIETL